jgi:hypothetical protein
MVTRTTASAEIARQDHYLDKLGGKHTYPLFSSRDAIKSQRRSGYKNTARAAREIVDNALEAGASNVWVTFDTAGSNGLADEGRKRGRGKNKNSVSAIAFIDDGPGMKHENDKRSMLRYALSWGGGTHSEDPDFIGKFGFGLPNASVNQTELVEVYTRTSADSGWNKCFIDIRQGSRMLDAKTGVVNVPDVETDAELPDFVQEFLRKRKIELTTGTIVVWVQPDNLYRKGRELLRKHLERDFECVYRYLLDDINMFIDSNEPLSRVDLLFLNPKGRWYLPPDEGGAVSLYDEHIQVLAYRDGAGGVWEMETVGPEAGTDPLTDYRYDRSFDEAESFRDNPPNGEVDVVLTSISVKASYLPYPTFMSRGAKDGADEFAVQRFRLKEGRYGISFVRAQREIDTFDALPKGEDASRRELGRWPTPST